MTADGQDAPPASVFLRPVGSPLTIGMAGLAIASVVTSGLGLSWISKAQAVEVGIVLVPVPFVLQLVGSVFSYLARDGAAGATVGVLATTWLAFGLVRLASGSSQSGALGLLLLVAAAMLALSSVALAGAKPLPGQRQPVLRAFRRGRGEAAVERGFAAQLDGVANEPGVRQTT